MQQGIQRSRLRKSFFLLIFFGLGCIPSAEAYCGAHPSVEQEFKTSKVVIIGAVSGSKDIVGADGFIRGTLYSIRISEVLKGSRRKMVQLYSENSSGRFPMEVGTKYLIFGYQGVFEGMREPCLAVDNCGNSELFRRWEKAVAAARKFTEQSGI